MSPHPQTGLTAGLVASRMLRSLACLAASMAGGAEVVRLDAHQNQWTRPTLPRCRLQRCGFGTPVHSNANTGRIAAWFRLQPGLSIFPMIRKPQFFAEPNDAFGLGLAEVADSEHEVLIVEASCIRALCRAPLSERQ